MIHYHGTPITPNATLRELSGRNFCVRYGRHEQVGICHEIGQSVMLDNRAFSFWRAGTPTDWPGFYRWVRPWLDCQSTWAVIPDVIGGNEADNDALIDQWDLHIGPDLWNAAPVWHLHESFHRLKGLATRFPRICFGSSGEYSTIGSPAWNNRMNEAFNVICRGSGHPPCAVHMLRGMSLSGSIYPFASVDSADIGRNHGQVPGRALRMAQRWDGQQAGLRWIQKEIQQVLVPR